MTPIFILSIIGFYFLVLIGISYLTSKGANNESFFLANKQSPWYLVAFGMIGASLSGITFISIPGWVGDGAKQFSYMQMVFGYLLGYVVIAYVLMPIYYKLNVTSIYTYLKNRYGNTGHKIGALYFLLSRVTGASIRLLLVANVLQAFVFNTLGVPFEITVLISILLIWIYTFRGGIKTIIWTDTLQTLFMLLSLGITIYFISSELDFSDKGMIGTIADSDYSKIFFFDNWFGGNHFIKMFFGGMFITIGMTGLDQDMMQKNLSCKNLKEAQKNMMSFAVVLVIVNLIFLALGALLYMYAIEQGILVPEKTDLLFPTIALESKLGIGVGILFLLGLVAAAYSSADSALTSLTTSVCVDFLEKDEKKVTEKTRRWVHVGMSGVLFLTIIILNLTLDESAIWQLITLAGYTYGPLIGLFFFGILTKRVIGDFEIILVCVLSPVLTWIINDYVSNNSDFVIGALLILLNASLTFLGLLGYSQKKEAVS